MSKKYRPYTLKDQERDWKRNPPCQKCGQKKVIKVQYGYKDRDWEYSCQCGHKWE